MVASGLTTAAANVLIDYSHGTSNSTTPTGAHKLAITTTAPSAASAGTKVSGPADQTLTMASASGTSAASSGACTYSSMPVATVVGTDEYDSAGTPFRWWFAQLGTSRTTASGDTLTIATGAYTTALNPST